MKIRYKTWYWGKFIINGTHGYTINQNGFELYDESQHGWHRSAKCKNEVEQ